MAELRMLKLVGGLGNGLAVPAHWEGGQEYEYQHPGTDEVSTYSQRQYFHDLDTYYVWVRKELDHPTFLGMMFWHFEMQRGNQVAAQKDLLHTSMTTAMQYTNVVMAVGFAAMFTLWAQTKGTLTPASTLWAGILLALSVLLFIVWEISQMVVRSMLNIRIARAVGDIDRFYEHMRSVGDLQQAITRRYYVPWVAVLAVTIALALGAFVIMLSGMVHGAWLEFLADSLRKAAATL
jgi:hypothetical protein